MLARAFFVGCLLSEWKVFDLWPLQHIFYSMYSAFIILNDDVDGFYLPVIYVY